MSLRDNLGMQLHSVPSEKMQECDRQHAATQTVCELLLAQEPPVAAHNKLLINVVWACCKLGATKYHVVLLLFTILHRLRTRHVNIADRHCLGCMLPQQAGLQLRNKQSYSASP